MTPTIKSINLNDTPGTDAPQEGSAVPFISQEQDEREPPATPPTDAPAAGGADDIDTDELEALLVDLKETKKRNKATPKKRVRNPKAITPEPEPMEEAPIVVEQAPEPEVVPALEAVPEQKPKRKYIRKPHVAPETPPPPAQEPIDEPVKRSPLGMIEEMQRAERALRYQMRKNKMQTLVSQAF